MAVLAFDDEAAVQGLKPPPLLRDPFDRKLVAHAIAHGAAIVTLDSLLSQYPIRVVW